MGHLWKKLPLKENYEVRRDQCDTCGCIRSTYQIEDRLNFVYRRNQITFLIQPDCTVYTQESK